MKLFTLISLFIVMSVTASSQVNKGQFLVGGNINFNSTKNGGYKTTSLVVAPNIGYFIIDKLAAGVRLNLASYHQTIGSVSSTNTNTSLSPFARYYFLPAAKMVNVFIDGSYNHFKNKNRYESQPANTSTSYGYTVSAGPSIFFNQHIALEFTVGYQSTVQKNIPGSTITQFNSGLGLQIHLGKIKSKSA
ncbi:outer membrane beta-barrel protein [Ferruginibacter paludis]|uniref:outer membrane beta-barrel protein n=1 Tax=Ferruginibacter paludis TaxID=1310417 RepID=UPI0025B46D8D|nr:outer membrane beta-barrel protein [Ferruginibacter paludis]MDN3657362.1 outer membrane beta-barrel protein [Ferruginibacter paludis]